MGSFFAVFISVTNRMFSGFLTSISLSFLERKYCGSWEVGVKKNLLNNIFLLKGEVEIALSIHTNKLSLFCSFEENWLNFRRQTLWKKMGTEIRKEI